jgi:multidrug efflux pump
MVSLKPKQNVRQSSHAIVERMKQNAPWQAGAIFSARVEQELELDDPFSSGSGQDYMLLLQSDDVAQLRPMGAESCAGHAKTA